jgi:mannosyltransferase OCH1-like enzyme
MFKKRMIPKIVHQMAPKNKSLWHPFWEKCHVSWKYHFPESEYEHILWDDSKIDEFIESEFPEYVNFYYSLPFHVMQLDFARYCIIYKYGGIYVDMDFYCFKNFYNDLTKNIFFVESPSDKEIIQNSLFGSSKNNKHILNIIMNSKKTFYYYEIITDRSNINFTDYVLSTCGPILISNYYRNLQENNKNTIQILEKSKFNPGIYDDDNDLDCNCIHILTGSWGRDNIKNRMQHCGKSEISYEEYSIENYKTSRPFIYKKMKELLS